MNLFEMFRKKTTAPVARDRLQVLLAHERSVIGKNDLLAMLEIDVEVPLNAKMNKPKTGIPASA